MKGVSLLGILEILIWESVSLLEILIWIKECGLKIYRICPIRIEIIYGRVSLLG
jgi:hypothetical protein